MKGKLSFNELIQTFTGLASVTLLGVIAERSEPGGDMLTVLVQGHDVRPWYSVEEFAHRVGRSEFTIRHWCRLGRIEAQKKASGRGAHASWAIPHAELERYRREGLLPAKQH